jgi:D-galactarolactone isomerase
MTVIARRTPMPAGSCDCHMHFYGHPSTYLRMVEPHFSPPPAEASAYSKVLRRLGLERFIAVQSVIYGFDNTCLLDGMAEFGDRARGVAVIASDSTDLNVLHVRGVRGVRAYMLQGGVYSWGDLTDIAARIGPYNWHLQVQLDGRELVDRSQFLADLPCRIVIDHIGKFLGPVGTNDPAFRSLLRLIDRGRCWVKLSAPYESSRVGPPDYADVSVLARALVSHAPDRMLWATNWPHTALHHKPEDADLLDLLSLWAPQVEVRDRILAANPAEIYDFALRCVQAPES